MDNEAILQGLVYFDVESDKYLVDPDDFIVITASAFNPDSPMESKELSIGAKVKFGKVKIPLQLRLFKENILQGSGSEWESGDLLVSARVCPNGLAKYPCTDQESKFLSKGVAKRIVVPGSDDVHIWTPASLQLKSNKAN